MTDRQQAGIGYFFPHKSGDATEPIAAVTHVTLNNHDGRPRGGGDLRAFFLMLRHAILGVVGGRVRGLAAVRGERIALGLRCC